MDHLKSPKLVNLNDPNVVIFFSIYCKIISERRIIYMKNLVGVIMIIKDMNVKPNYSELERIYGVDRHIDLIKGLNKDRDKLNAQYV
ncbi:hypothetical protein SG0102_23980 [Intestinibaculum porci]|uniref:Uncharacterized protein n=1 Tax=Intestinibaculum porci TaxID=2487118 RepID=A0A3G9JXE0_9FIRM|nr:hypothetical protein SG0102_23980 [Intestinibaculum porci]